MDISWILFLVTASGLGGLLAGVWLLSKRPVHVNTHVEQVATPVTNVSAGSGSGAGAWVGPLLIGFVGLIVVGVVVSGIVSIGNSIIQAVSDPLYQSAPVQQPQSVPVRQPVSVPTAVATAVPTAVPTVVPTEVSKQIEFEPVETTGFGLSDEVLIALGLVTAIVVMGVVALTLRYETIKLERKSKTLRMSQARQVNKTDDYYQSPMWPTQPAITFEDECEPDAEVWGEALDVVPDEF